MYLEGDSSSISMVLENGELAAAYRIPCHKPDPAAEAYFARIVELRQAYADRKKRGKHSLRGLMK